MKYLKPLMLVIAGFAITMLVSFKNEEPKVETAKVYMFNTEKKFRVVYDNGVIKDYTFPEIKEWMTQYHIEEIKILNSLNKDGWRIVGIQGAMTYLERTKQ